MATMELKNPERATPMMGLYHDVFIDLFIFRYIFEHLFPQENGISKISTPFKSSFAHLNKIINTMKRELASNVWSLQENNAHLATNQSAHT